MNPRLLAYLRSLGLAEDAPESQVWEFFSGLRGVQRSIANCLNYVEADQQARTNCDLMLRSMGFDPADPTKALIEDDDAQERAGTDGASVAGDLERARAEGQEAERTRRAQIEQLATMAGASEDLTRTLIDSGTDVEGARDRIWRDHQERTRANVPADMPNPAAHSRNSVTGYTVETLQAGMLHSRNLDPTTQWAVNNGGTPRFRTNITPDLERAIEAGYEFRSASLETMLRMCARIDNVNLPMGRSGLLEAYIRSMSTSALSAVFTTNVNSELLAAFDTAPDSTTGGWIRDSDVADFRTNERARMENGGQLKKLPRGSEADHATYEDLVEVFKIARYAKQFVIDDQDIQDDNFGGLSGFVPADMGVAARELRPDLIYSLLLANAAMRDGVALFHTATHGNLNATAALSTTTLQNGRSKMRLQREGVRNLNINGKFLIVPPTLEDTADVLINSRLMITGENDTKPERNPNANKGLVAVVDARLENGVTDPTDGSGGTVHAGSASTWFLSATRGSHTIEFAYLRGTGRRPQIRPFVLNQGKWGLGWDVKFDVGAKALDWRGLQKNTA